MIAISGTPDETGAHPGVNVPTSTLALDGAGGTNEECSRKTPTMSLFAPNDSSPTKETNAETDILTHHALRETRLHSIFYPPA